MKKPILIFACLSLTLTFSAYPHAEKSENPSIEEGAASPVIRQLKDGSYTPSFKCISALCGLASCTLNVTDGQMYADLVFDSADAAKVYPSIGAEAEKADDTALLPAVITDSCSAVTVPVSSLDEALHFALFRPEENKWYEALITVSSEDLPEDAFTLLTPVTAEMLGLSDGLYTAEVTLEGGSGRAGLISPAELTLADGAFTARIVFSSSSYDYVLKGDVRYEPASLEDGSAFLLPIEGLDFPLMITADTTAMSQPHEIDYTICFDSATLEEITP